jgi:hypothetical protein
MLGVDGVFSVIGGPVGAVVDTSFMAVISDSVAWHWSDGAVRSAASTPTISTAVTMTCLWIGAASEQSVALFD